MKGVYNIDSLIVLLFFIVQYSLQCRLWRWILWGWDWWMWCITSLCKQCNMYRSPSRLSLPMYTWIWWKELWRHTSWLSWQCVHERCNMHTIPTRWSIRWVSFFLYLLISITEQTGITCDQNPVTWTVYMIK